MKSLSQTAAAIALLGMALTGKRNPFEQSSNQSSTLMRDQQRS